MNGGPTPQHQLPEDRDDLTRQDWFGVWPGTVVDTLDPEQRGRIRVRVDQVYGPATRPDGDQKIPDPQLPWAQPCFPWVGLQAGALAVPPVGAGVWVAFWQGDHKFPVWIGGWAGAGDAPIEFTSSYGPPGISPCTRVVKTPTGQTFEMRWCPEQEEIRLQTSDGSIISMREQTSGGPSVSITTPGDFNVTAQGAVNQTYSLDSMLTALAALTIAVTTALTLTAGGVLSLTGAGLVLATTTGLVSLGVAGAKRKLVTENYITAIQNPNVTAYNGHTHSHGSGPGTTGVPSAPMIPAVTGTHSTVNTEAN